MKAFPVHDSACNDHCREAFRYGGLGLEGRCHCFLGATDFTQPQFFRYSGCSLNLSNMKVGHDRFFEKIIGIPYGRYYYCWLISKQQNFLHFMCGKRNLMPKLLFTLHCLFFTSEFALTPSSSSIGTSIKIHVYMYLIYITTWSRMFKHYLVQFSNISTGVSKTSEFWNLARMPWSVLQSSKTLSSSLRSQGLVVWVVWFGQVNHGSQ